VDIRGLEWDDQNEAHLWEHKLTSATVEQVVGENPIVLRNKGGRRGKLKIVGPDYGGALWTVILAPTRRRGIWYPVTGWRSTPGERTLYETRKRGRDD
jgi:hypothetical protein